MVYGMGILNIFLELVDKEPASCRCATQADVGKLENPAWSKSNQQARTGQLTRQDL